MDDFSTFASLQTTKGTTKYQVQDSVAQLVEQYTFNVWVLGSNPSGITKKSNSKRVAFFVPDGFEQKRREGFDSGRLRVSVWESRG